MQPRVFPTSRVLFERLPRCPYVSRQYRLGRLMSGRVRGPASIGDALLQHLGLVEDDVQLSGRELLEATL